MKQRYMIYTTGFMTETGCRATIKRIRKKGDLPDETVALSYKTKYAPESGTRVFSRME